MNITGFKQLCESYDRWIDHTANNMITYYDELTDTEYEDALIGQTALIQSIAVEYFVNCGHRDSLYKYSIESLVLKDVRARIKLRDTAWTLYTLVNGINKDATVFLEDWKVVQGAHCITGPNRIEFCQCKSSDGLPTLRLHYGGKKCLVPLSVPLNHGDILDRLTESMDLYGMHRENEGRRTTTVH